MGGAGNVNPLGQVTNNGQVNMNNELQRQETEVAPLTQSLLQSDSVLMRMDGLSNDALN